MSSKGILAMMLVLVFFVPGAYGISVKIAGSQSGNSFFDATTFSALDRDSLSVHSVVNGAAIAQEATGSSDLHKSFGASSHRGETARITADVVNAGSWEYTQPVMVADDTSASVTGFVLTATDADTIKCNTLATDRRGDKASAAIEVYQGSLSNYRGDAIASSSGLALAVQSFDSALGSQVAAKERASNPTGATITNTNIQNGGILGYSNYGGTFADQQFGQQLIETIGQFEFAGGDTVSTESSAYRTCGYRSNAKMDVQNGQVNGYGSAAGVGFGFETGAQQFLFGWIAGNVIGLTASSSNGERDMSSLKTDIRGIGTEPGFISEYRDLTESFQGDVFANNAFGQAGGDEIHLSSSASNREKDRANTNMDAIGEGQIANFEGSSSATAKTASASNGNIFSSIAISGNDIGYDASASDALRNRANVSTLAHEGLIVGLLNSATVDNTFARDLTTYQSATIVSGSMMEIDAMAINRAKQKESLKSPIINPAGIRYENFAGVTTGIPAVYQTMVI